MRECAALQGVFVLSSGQVRAHIRTPGACRASCSYAQTHVLFLTQVTPFLASLKLISRSKSSLFFPVQNLKCMSDTNTTLSKLNISIHPRVPPPLNK